MAYMSHHPLSNESENKRHYSLLVAAAFLKDSLMCLKILGGSFLILKVGKVSSRQMKSKAENVYYNSFLMILWIF